MSITDNTFANENNSPLDNLDQWENDVLDRYPDPASINKDKKEEEFRNYEETSKDGVKEFYRLNHKYQTYDFVLEKKADYLKFDKREMPIWNAFDFLNELVDDSDPDTDLDQMQHLVQTSEAIRNDGHPDWMVLVGLIHDMGKVLCLFGEPQWGVVGDTFPVGCAYSDKIVYPEFFKANPDYDNKKFNTKLGIYTENCGLDQVHMSWGHDEYVYHMMKDYIPEPGLYMLRYHSFYSQHRENAYDHLMNEKDHEMFKWVALFNPYDLYSKNPNQKSWEELKPYYQALVAKYLPTNLKF
ncbi:inositol oxygenase [Pedobacter sp. LMG 31464]|uniref:Inositol oxygenase n=1 Tax=Pedobacter planticolens TaxID=2679964 RepID=A0A923DYQ1_9SPHI|nr:inositol oxygenase family protein [Pedobacter planticolens]MBB2144903.1 inositol oxygenase [Pedobacter planticolens]